MDWVNDFQLFLLDFDGLLVNTEQLHYKAYLRMCSERGFKLDWSFEDFCGAAHSDSKMLRVKIYQTLPDLHSLEPNWSILYTEKKKHYLDILKETDIELMPGVENFLTKLKNQNIPRCVVTHSPREQVDFIRSQNKVLQTIDTWITREDYNLSKPNSEPYLTAIKKMGANFDKIIGFEDSPRGLYALMGTPAKAIYVNESVHGEMIPLIKENKVQHFNNFTDISKIS